MHLRTERAAVPRPRATLRFSSLLATAALIAPSGLAACGGGVDEIDVAAAPPTVVSGRYDVKGTTRSPGSQHGRAIEGTVIIVQTEAGYTATYELETTWLSEGSETVADVVGVGEGTIAGGRLEGDARTQLVISTVPGVDPGFAFVPRHVTARLESASVATIDADGSIEIALENHGVAGEAYEPTVTRLVGRRVDVTRPASADPPQ